MRGTDAVLLRRRRLRLRLGAGLALALLFAAGFAFATSQSAGARPSGAVATSVPGVKVIGGAVAPSVSVATVTVTTTVSVPVPTTVSLVTTRTVQLGVAKETVTAPGATVTAPAGTVTATRTVTTSHAVAATRTVTATNVVTTVNTVTRTLTQTSATGWTWTAGGLALVAVLAAGTVGSLLRRSRRRAAWQLTASSDELPARCAGSGTYCKLDQRPKPGRRTVSSITVGGRLEASESVVGGVNDAVAVYRRNGPGEDVRLALLPVADALHKQIAERFDDGGTVSADAHLTGGKLESAFTLYRCLGGVWVQQQRWTVEGDDERDVGIGELQLPASVERVTALLAAFVTGVDVPEREAAPERLPVTHV
jgi:hypothetical protein